MVGFGRYGRRLVSDPVTALPIILGQNGFTFALPCIGHFTGGEILMHSLGKFNLRFAFAIFGAFCIKFLKKIPSIVMGLCFMVIGLVNVASTIARAAVGAPDYALGRIIS